MLQVGLLRRRSVSALILTALSCVALYAGRSFTPAPGAQVVADELIIQVNDGVDVYGLVRSIAPEAYIARSAGRNTHLLKFSGAVPQARIDALARNPNVRFVEPNQIRHTQVSAPNDPSYTSQWALNTVHALDAWNVIPGTWTIPGNRVKVAVLDTGIDCTQPDFKGTSGSVDSASGGQINMTLSTAIVATTITGGCAFQDDHGHGTHTAGTVAAATQNGTLVSSLGYPLEIVAYKVVNAQGNGSDFDIATGITSAADAGVSVISMSLGGTGYSQALQDAVDYAWQRNVVVVAAAGNSNTNALFYPAGAFHALAVAATDSTDARAGFSNFGRAIGIAAPGVNILSLYPVAFGASGTAIMSGTSMATPHVSAVAGLVAMTTPSAPAEAIVRRIQQSGTSSSWDANLGYGIVNAFRAVSGAPPAAATGSVVARVVDSQNLPLAATVTISGTSASTDASGSARLPNLAPGLYSITFTASGYPSGRATVAVVSGADSTVLLRAGVATGTVQGTVTAASQPLGGASVVARSNGIIAGSTVADPLGRYSLALPAGTYSMTASALGYKASASAFATVSVNVQQTLNFNLVEIGRVAGFARDSAGGPIVGATLSITGPQTTVATSNATGAFATIGVAPGQYTATCASAGLAPPPTTTLTVVNGADTTFNCVFSAVTVTVTPTPVSLAAGKQAQFTAAIDGSPSAAVTWTRTPAVGTVSTTGLYTAPVTVNGETVTITATSTAYPGRSGNATIHLGIGSVPTIVLSPVKVTGGVSTTLNKVQLAGPAPTGGATVTLTSSNRAVVPPATVSVPAGATESAAFAIATSAVAADTPVVITASYNGATSTSTLTVLRAVLSSVSLSPAIVGGGATTTANRVNLTGQAPAGGFAVSLLSATPALASVPASVTVPAGATFATFAISTSSTTQATSVKISATNGAITKSANLTVNPVTLSTLTLTSTTIRSGLSTTTNKVTLNGPAPAGGAAVTISATKPPLTAPTTVTVPQGSTSATFTLAAALVDASKPFTVSAAYGAVTKTVSGSVEPAILSNFSVTPASAVGGTTISATAFLSGAAGPSGIVVNLANGGPAAAIVPASISIAAGATNGKATFTATPVSASATLALTASYAGVTKSASHTVLPPDVVSVVLVATAKGGTSTTTNRVRLNGVAPAGGKVVALSSANAAVASVPATVTVAAGQTYSPYFTVVTHAVAANTSVVITATTPGKSATATVTVTP